MYFLWSSSSLPLAENFIQWNSNTEENLHDQNIITASCKLSSLLKNGESTCRSVKIPEFPNVDFDDDIIVICIHLYVE